MPNKFIQHQGVWIPGVDPANIGFDNYKTLTNLRYLDRGLQVVQGYTLVNTISIGPVPAPVFSPSGGTFAAPFSLTITSSPTATIYYTIDGSTPTSSDTEFTEAIAVSVGTTFKAIAIQDNGLKSEVTTETYLFATSFLITSDGDFVIASDGKFIIVIG